MVLVYTLIRNARIEYTLSEVFPAFKITTQKAEFVAYNGNKIWYHQDPPPANCLHIVPTLSDVWVLGKIPLLPQVSLIYFQNGDSRSLPILFNGKGHLGFDVFAAIFYMLSCSAEYSNKELVDSHGRFTGHPELKRIYKQRVPVVETWKFMIEQSFTNLGFGNSKRLEQGGLKLTIDIDNWFAFKSKSILKQVGGSLRDFFKFGPKAVVSRFLTLTGKQQDPFDPVKTLETLRQNQLRIFVLNALHDSQYNKNIKLTKDLINSIKNDQFTIGIHPSYQSNNKALVWKQELDSLSGLLNQPITISRFHYLKFQLPEDYRILIDLGITEDHSMLFSSIVGWRAGTCLPFQWYDLENDKATTLTIYPYLTMDTRLLEYYQKQPQAALDWLKDKYYLPLKALGLPLPLVLHNESLSDYGAWKGWDNFLNGLIGLEQD